MTATATRKHYTTAEANKLVRADLKAAFPGTKFSVRKHGTSVTVSWEDGPATADVEAVVGKYEGNQLSYCMDYTDYKTTYDDEGNEVDYGIGWVNTRRTFSEDMVTRATAKTCELLGADTLTEALCEDTWPVEKYTGEYITPGYGYPDLLVRMVAGKLAADEYTTK